MLKSCHISLVLQKKEWTYIVCSQEEGIESYDSPKEVLCSEFQQLNTKTQNIHISVSLADM